MKKITLLIFLVTPAISFAQVDFGSPTASAMGGAVTSSARAWEAIGINPANLGYKDNPPFSMSIANVGINLVDNGLTIPEARAFNTSGLGTDSSTTGQMARQQILNALTCPGGLNLSMRVNLASFSFNIPKIGGLAISLTDEIYGHLQLGQNAATLITDALTVSQGNKNSVLPFINKDSSMLIHPNQIFNGSSAGGYDYREINIDYGRKLLTIQTHSAPDGGASFENSDYLAKPKKTDTTSAPIEIYGGGGFKPVWGFAGYNGPIDATQNILEGTNVTYPGALLKYPFEANGRGYGIDLGLSATYKKFKFAISAIDLGKITWQNNYYFTPYSKKNVDSIENALLNQAKNGGSVTVGNSSNPIQNVLQYIGYQKAAPNFTTQLPSKFRTGVSYEPISSIILSADFVAPLNTVQGNILNPYYAAGLHIKFFQIFAFSVGAASEKGFGTIIPAGFFLNMGGAEIFVATNDVFAFVNNSTSHVISASFGIKLFGF